jgi:hypothetical protein
MDYSKSPRLARRNFPWGNPATANPARFAGVAPMPDEEGIIEKGAGGVGPPFEPWKYFEVDFGALENFEALYLIVYGDWRLPWRAGSALEKFGGAFLCCCRAIFKEKTGRSLAWAMEKIVGWCWHFGSVLGRGT